MNPTDGDRRSSYTSSYALLHPSIIAARPRNRVLKSVKRRPFWGDRVGFKSFRISTLRVSPVTNPVVKLCNLKFHAYSVLIVCDVL